jgi:hypothetical protein
MICHILDHERSLPCLKPIQESGHEADHSQPSSDIRIEVLCPLTRTNLWHVV